MSWLWRSSAIKRVTHCGRVTLGSDVVIRASVGADGQRHAGVAGVVHCGSVWACPVCSAKIAAQRSAMVGEVLRRWVERGGSVAMVTLTVRHSKGDPLATVWDAVSAGWRAATRSSAWDQLQRVYGTEMVTGKGSRAALRYRIPSIRVVEVTHGANGWHVHVHALLLLRGGVEVDQVPQIGASMWGRWDRAVQRAGLRGGDLAQMDAHLIRWDPRGVTPLAEYFAKATYEVTLAGNKSARGGNRTPFQVLACMVEYASGELVQGDNDAARDRRIWGEWERSSRGRRQIGITNGLLDVLEMRDWMPTDEEIVEAEMGGDELARFSREEWGRIALWGLIPDLLQAAEQSTAALHKRAVEVLALLRTSPPPPW